MKKALTVQELETAVELVLGTGGAGERGGVALLGGDAGTENGGGGEEEGSDLDHFGECCLLVADGGELLCWL